MLFVKSATLYAPMHAGSAVQCGIGMLHIMQHNGTQTVLFLRVAKFVFTPVISACGFLQWVPLSRLKYNNARGGLGSKCLN